MSDDCRGRSLDHVFVYGTLLRGESNHRILAAAQFLRVARTRPEYHLHDLGPYPALVPGGTTAIVGEVYAIDAATLAALDRLEGHPSYYERVPITLADDAVAHAYLMSRSIARGTPVIASGDWRAHRRPFDPTTRRKGIAS
jgi:gamma-glutamylcyclotransferase (GGCT)/AIG2-like uncharacterized protein YtfP